MRKTGIVAALLLMGLSQAAFAENRGETVTFAPYIGGYTFQGSQHLETSPVFGFRLGYNFTENWALEGVIDYLNTEGTSGSGIGKNQEMLRYGGDLLYNFMPKNSFVPYLAAGAGAFNFNNQKARGIYNYGGGVKWFVADNFALRADVRGLNYSVGKLYTNVEYTLGLHIAVGAPKPAPAPVVVAEPVVEAAAPKAAPVVVTPPPAPAPAPTSKLTAEPATFEKGKTTTLTWSSANASGCEIQPGIGPVPASGSKVVTPAANTSYTLICNGEGGKTATSVAGVEVTEPVVEAAAAKASAVAAGSRLALKVNFDTGKSIIKKQYYDELKVVGDGLNEQKNLKGVIEGHTDNVGNAKANQLLSQRRANAVRDYIVKNFKIDKKRLTAKGFGESKPIADNATAEGRAQNRRIEATFEEISNVKADADQQPAKPVKKAVKGKVAKKKAAAKK